MKEKIYTMAKTDILVEIPALLETAYEERREHITFGKILNDHYATYTPVILSVPASLHPEVYESGSGDMRIRFRPDDNMRFPAAQLHFHCQCQS